MTAYSNSKPGKPVSNKFRKYQTREVVTSLSESKQVAKDLAASKKWIHRAKVSVVGNASVKPYQPIYLDGLPNGLSGYWTVLSVRHTFGGMPAKYLLELEVGTDIIGEVYDNATKSNPLRNVQAEISGQSTTAQAESKLSDFTVFPNSSTFTGNNGFTNPTAVATPSPVAVPEGITKDIYSTKAPNFGAIDRTTKWSSGQRTGVQNV